MNIITPLITAILLLNTNLTAAESADPIWRFTVRKPAKGWQKVEFDDSRWAEGYGGFGERSTPGSRISTDWTTKNIWLRRIVELDKAPGKPALYIYHDEDAEVFINGRRVAEFKGFITEYQVVPLDDIAREAVRVGENLVAVHCRQTTGGQAIDVHLIDANQVPKLPPPRRREHPFQSELITAWGAEVTAENAWREYPRPQLVRENWINLNGHWDYAITDIDAGRPAEWDGKILVPFAVESKLSGVQRLLHDDQALWYRRSISAGPSEGKRTILNFEACDYRTEVWVNGTRIGEHVGGNTPFSFDVTNALTPGQDTLVVRVEDSTGGFQLRGKQTDTPRGIWYTQVSGIWGTVWLEEVAETHVSGIKFTTANSGEVTVELRYAGDVTVLPATVLKASLAGQEIATANGRSENGKLLATLDIPRPKLWSPESPTLYELEITFGLDKVSSYFGIREVGKVKDADGHWRFTLNGETIFHWGPLDQGWWPDGLLTPPSDAGMRWDVDHLKAAGFNMIRKHIKVEPRRFYAYCDQVGMMVWQDQPSGGPKPKWTRLQPNPKDADWPDDAHRQFMQELDRMITTLGNHPCIVQWVPFNEAWGQHRTMRVGKWTAERDPTRHVNIASGGNFWPVGDVVDHHAYPHPQFPFDLGKGGRFDSFIKVMGEFGGHGLPTPDHLWDNKRRNWGYGGLPKDAAEYKERYRGSLRLLVELKEKGIAGGVYTQTTDVEGEINGLVTYDRKRVKIPAEELAELHRVLLK